MPGAVGAVKAVLFDLYETLVTHFDPNWAPHPRSIAEWLGLEETVYGEHWPPLDKAWQAGEIEHYEEALTRVCEVVGRVPDASVLAELTHEYRTMPVRVFEAVEPEVMEMVAALKGSGLVLGVVTNASDLDAEPWAGSALVYLQYRFRAVRYSCGHENSNLRTFTFGKGA